MRKTLSLAAVVTAAAALVAVPGTASAAPPVKQVQWVACPADVALPGLECGKLQVPLDYRKPEGRQTEVAITRLASKNPEKRKGVLLTNPGGPERGPDVPVLPEGVGTAAERAGRVRRDRHSTRAASATARLPRAT